MEHTLAPPVQREDIVTLPTDPLRKIREGQGRLVPSLALALGKIDRLAIQPARRARLETPHLETKLPQRVAQRRERVSHSPSRLVPQAHMKQPPHKRAAADHHRFAAEPHTHVSLHSCHPAVLYEDACSVPLLEIQQRLPLQHRLRAKLISLLVALRPWRSDARPLSRIEHPELDARSRRCSVPSSRPRHRSPAPSVPSPARRLPGCTTFALLSPSSARASACGIPAEPPPARPQSRHAQPRRR